ncbi:MAG: hypothetical protein H6618_01270 [Deltaproteobacteria bacterium]|nr:hypothetical protein [Deltaproteobacteria bacterium]
MVNIEKLSKDVACWRKSKKSRGERIPAHLLSMALELSRLHGIEAIAKSGSFTRDQLQKAMNGRPDQQKEQKSTEVPLKYGILEVPARSLREAMILNFISRAERNLFFLQTEKQQLWQENFYLCMREERDDQPSLQCKKVYVLYEKISFISRLMVSVPWCQMMGKDPVSSSFLFSATGES